VVTRRPLVLQLYSIPHPGQKSSSSSEGGSSGGVDSEPFYPLDDEHGGGGGSTAHVTGRSGRRGER
jgi:hypothetical protein